MDVYNNLEAGLQAVLFTSTEAVASKKLAEIFQIDISIIEKNLFSLQEKLSQSESGICLKQIAGGWRLFSNPNFHDVIEKYVISLDTRKLSCAALETLSIVAFSQPVTRAGIAACRGVNSDSSLNSLIEKGLVKEAGCANVSGNPSVYCTTQLFLEQYGLNSLSDLPNIEDFAPDETTKKHIFERLSTTHVEFIKQLDENDDEQTQSDQQTVDNIDPKSATETQVSQAKQDHDKAQSSDSLFADALSSALGVTEKVNLDNIELNTDDE